METKEAGPLSLSFLLMDYVCFVEKKKNFQIICIFNSVISPTPVSEQASFDLVREVSYISTDFGENWTAEVNCKNYSHSNT